MTGDNNHIVKANAQNIDRSLPHNAEHVALTSAAPA
jgi:hypothetical protein